VRFSYTSVLDIFIYGIHTFFVVPVKTQESPSYPFPLHGFFGSFFGLFFLFYPSTGSYLSTCTPTFPFHRPDFSTRLVHIIKRRKTLQSLTIITISSLASSPKRHGSDDRLQAAFSNQLLTLDEVKEDVIYIYIYRHSDRLYTLRDYARIQWSAIHRKKGIQIDSIPYNPSLAYSDTASTSIAANFTN
jgi:hypothetical protein